MGSRLPYKNPEDKRKYQKKYFSKYYANPEKKALVKERVRSRKRDLRVWFLGYKESKSCVVCGMSGKGNPWALEFHHRDPSQKRDIVSGMVAGGYSKKRIKEEIEKCDIVCANCHRAKHYQEKIEHGESVFEKSGSKPRPEVDTPHGRRARKRNRKSRKKHRKLREQDNDEKAPDSDKSQ